MTFDRRTFVMQLLALLTACGGEVTIDPPPVDAPVPPADPDSTFHAIYDDPARAADFKGCFEEVFRLYPPDALHDLVGASTRSHATDERIYQAIAQGLPQISPRARLLTLALPALQKQKRVMASESAALLKRPSGQTWDGYLEIGTTGRYARALGRAVPLSGDVYVCNDRAPSKDPADIVERGQLNEVGTFVPLEDYAPVGIPANSVALITNFIGFHHAPLERLDGFIDGLRRALKPDGVLLLREHDVTDPRMGQVAALAHDVFNAGTELTWAENQAEFRAFRSVGEWTKMLQSRGFTRLAGAELQAGDPTANTLLAFQKA